MLISKPFLKEGVLVTIFKIPPGATLPYNSAELPFNISTFSKEATSGMEPLVKRKPFLNILFAVMS